MPTVEFDRDHAAAERLRRELLGSGFAFMGLSAAELPSAGRFGGLETHDDTVTNVRVVYETAQPDGAWASVDTSRWAGTNVSAGPLRQLIEHHMRLRGEYVRAVAWADGDTTVVVDSAPVAGHIVRAGSRWWAARCERDGLEISVVARDWHPAVIAVDTVADPGPMLAAGATRPRPARRWEPEPVPPGLAGEPHRALLDAVLQHSDRRAAWLADGGPVPELPGYWSALWQAATERQVAFAGGTESDARSAVRGMVDQLAGLRNEAPWFREDGELRQRAIAETFLYGTGLGTDVPSRAAQQAWQHRQSADDTSLHAWAAADRTWLDAWSSWAQENRQR